MIITVRKHYPLAAVIIIALITFGFFRVTAKPPSRHPLPVRFEMVGDEENLKNTYLVILYGLGCRYDGTSDLNTGFKALVKSLSKYGFPIDDEHILLYSYTGGKMAGKRWIPEKYGSGDTGQPIEWSVKRLAELIERFSLAHPEARYILIGHSLGGRIALDFASVTTEVNKKIKGVITLNSPLIGLDSAFPAYIRKHLNNSGTIWSSVAVNQIIWECGYWEELAAKRRAALKNLQKDGVHIATFSSDSDLLVRPISSCITDEKGKPITEGFIIKDSFFSFRDILGHNKILEDPLIAQYLFYLSTSAQ